MSGAHLSDAEAAHLMREVVWPPPSAGVVDAVIFGRPVKPPRKRTFKDDLVATTIGKPVISCLGKPSKRFLRALSQSSNEYE